VDSVEVFLWPLAVALVPQVAVRVLQADRDATVQPP